MVRNRFNNLTSKEWLPFQKSWYLHHSYYDVYKSNFRFFLKFDHPEFEPVAFYHGPPDRLEIIDQLSEELGFAYITDINKIKDFNFQFVLLDLLDDAWENLDEYFKKKAQILENVALIKSKMVHRRFLCTLSANQEISGKYFPFAWDLNYEIGKTFTLKDEKIACLDILDSSEGMTTFRPSQLHYYASYFRSDELSGEENSLFAKTTFFQNIEQESIIEDQEENIPSWNILKPKRRTKKEILHPAKFPEELLQLFLPLLSKEGENIFDPMSGTASTQLAALSLNRNGYGLELSEFFYQIGYERLSEYLNPKQKVLFEKDRSHLKFKILNKDIRKLKKKDFPVIDYIFTSPPYWDILNMRGAENQAKRKDKGLQLNYSEDEKDLGNIEDYQSFLKELKSIYDNLFDLLKPQAYMTIVVKNIKKKGRNYPFAYDLGHLLQDKWILCPEVFWLQDDIRIAPYGYGNTFVSNTFHQYCLTFQKPSI